jgi:hypothetical protein
MERLQEPKSKRFGGVQEWCEHQARLSRLSSSRAA